MSNTAACEPTGVSITKRATGIRVFDEISEGGLPCGQASIIVGAAGSGKTIFAMQTLRNAAEQRGEVGIFVCFEERPEDVIRNLASFGWNLEGLIDRKMLHLVNGRPPTDALLAGDADLSGLLSALDALAQRVDATWVVFDSLDAMLLAIQTDYAQRREIMRLHDWIETNGLTCLITAKRGASWGTELTEQSPLSYLVGCVIDLEATVVDTMSLRALRIVKYRGSAHYNNQVPCLVGARGFELLPVMPTSSDYKVFTDRLSTGIPALDDMFSGGILRGSAVLLTGAPGTTKTSLAGRFAEAVCERGEKALYVCFDESPAEIMRNLTSIGIHLRRHVDAGRLRMHGLTARWKSPDMVFACLNEWIERDTPTCLVVDPVSALIKGGGEPATMATLLRIIQLCKTRGVTVLLPSLVSKSGGDIEFTDIHASTIADVWIHLSFLVRSGERNRLLTIVKARGTAHSHQVRELSLGADGIQLILPYTEEGEVLVGTLRWQKEQQVRRAREEVARAEARRAREFDMETERLAQRIATLQHELDERNALAQRMTCQRQQAEADAAGYAATTLARRQGLPQADPGPRVTGSPSPDQGER